MDDEEILVFHEPELRDNIDCNEYEICCNWCESTIPSGDRYYKVEGKIYCPECMDNLFGHWN